MSLPRLARLARTTLLLLVTALWGCGSGEIRFDQGLRITSISLPSEAAPGTTEKLSITFAPAGPLKSDAWVFVHVEAQEPNCRVVQDRAPAGARKPTEWTSEPFVHEVELTFAQGCKPGRFNVFAGLYDRASGARLKVEEPDTPDNRVQLGWIDVVAASPDTATRAFSPTAVRFNQLMTVFRPWRGWGGGFIAVTALAAVLHLLLRRRTSPSDDQPRTASRPQRWAMLLPAVPFFLGILMVLEFVKDDAYISFRYAHNLIHGHGLTFNPGERVEGYTNFLWTVLMAPFEALGLDLFQVCEWLAAGLGLSLLVLVARITARHTGYRKDLSFLWGAAWLSCSSSFVLWAKSGLEQPLAMLLPIAGAWLLWTGRERQDIGRQVASAVCFAGACMTRPELHALTFFFGVSLLVEAIRQRRIDRGMVLWVVTILAITAPFHAARFLYYRDLFPNTFYVKTGAGDHVWKEGLTKLREMFGFNGFGALALLMPLAFVRRRLFVEKATMGVIALFFMVFMVKVGVDEMHWHRLYLPALPFAVILAALGLREVVDLLISAVPRINRIAAPAAAWAAVLFVAGSSFAFTKREMNGFNGHGDLTGTYHPDLGKFLVRHERPGALVAFQDMGSTPYHAPDIDFLDFIGLVDRRIAHARNEYGLHAFIGSDPNNKKPQFDREMRDYYFERNPEWAILTIYTPESQMKRIAEAFDRDPGPGALGDTYNNNPYQFGIWRDPRFKANYVHVRTWQRSRGYYLSLFRRKDLWEQTPGEVVLDAPPADLSGPTARFTNGLELLGARVENATDPSLGARTTARHEIMVTTWWRVPGPMESDVNFFIHLNNEAGFQAPADHVPGDSMYPADRWKPGQIIEDRYLFQLPMNMRPGDYTVHIGAYRRSTGDRFVVAEGAHDGANRVDLGPLKVDPLIPVLDQLIPPTRTEVMRKYPDRIVDSGRVRPYDVFSTSPPR